MAACQSCNRSKSDKFDYRVPTGFLSKIFDSILFGIQKIVVIVFVAVYVAIQKIFSGIAYFLLLPYRSHSWKAAVIVTLVYGLLIYGFLTRF